MLTEQPYTLRLQSGRYGSFQKDKNAYLCLRLNTFQPIAVKNLRAFSSSTLSFTSVLDCRIHTECGDIREGSFLFQHLCCCSVILQCFCMTTWLPTYQIHSLLAVFVFSLFNPVDLYYLGLEKNHTCISPRGHDFRGAGARKCVSD